MKETLQNLGKLKSIVTLILTGLLVYAVVVGKVEGQYFQTVYTTVIAFYFGTQYQKGQTPAVQVKEKDNAGE